MHSWPEMCSREKTPALRALSMSASSRTTKTSCRPFEGRLLQVLRRLGCYSGSGAFRPIYGGADDPVVGDDVGDLVRGNKQVGPGALGRAGLVYQLLEHGGAVRDDAGVFGEDGIAGSEVRREHPHQLIVREIPGLHDHHHAERMMLDPGFAERGIDLDRRKEAFGLASIEAGDFGDDPYLVVGVR